MSCFVLGIALISSIFWKAGAIDLLLGLFLFGCWAGWLARRHGWFCGIIVGVPLAFLQITRSAAAEYPAISEMLSDSDYWSVAVPAAVVSAGMAIMGGIVGAWLQDMHFQRRS